MNRTSSNKSTTNRERKNDHCDNPESGENSNKSNEKKNNISANKGRKNDYCDNPGSEERQSKQKKISAEEAQNSDNPEPEERQSKQKKYKKYISAEEAQNSDNPEPEERQSKQKKNKKAEEAQDKEREDDRIKILEAQVHELKEIIKEKNQNTSTSQKNVEYGQASSSKNFGSTEKSVPQAKIFLISSSEEEEDVRGRSRQRTTKKNKSLQSPKSTSNYSRSMSCKKVTFEPRHHGSRSRRRSRSRSPESRRQSTHSRSQYESRSRRSRSRSRSRYPESRSRRRSRSRSRSRSQKRRSDSRRQHSSSPSPSPSPSPSFSSAPSSPPSRQRSIKYLYTADMPKKFRDSLRRELFIVMDRLPPEIRLDLNETFENQKCEVNKIIIPAVKKCIDMNAFPVVDGVLYDMIHERHRHRRESLKLKGRSDTIRDQQARRKHKNSRRSEKRKRRAGMIEQLRNSKDPLIEKFSDQEIYPLTVDNRYHSPEESETDEDSNTEKRRIVIKDLQWRSSTTRMFLREYLDKLFEESSKVTRKRERVYDNCQFASNEKAPLNAPKWSLAKYNGSKKEAVKKACQQLGDEEKISILSSLSDTSGSFN